MKEFKIHPTFSHVSLDDTFDGTTNCGNKCTLDDSHCVDCVIYMTQEEIDSNWSNGGLIVRLFED